MKKKEFFTFILKHKIHQQYLTLEADYADGFISFLVEGQNITAADIWKVYCHIIITERGFWNNISFQLKSTLMNI